MARIKPEAEFSDTERFHAFYERATRIRQHPLFLHPEAGVIRPKLPEGVALQDVVDGSVKQPFLGIDFKLFEPSQWVDLACLVRPLIFTSTDKIRFKLTVAALSQAAPGLKEYTDKVNAEFKRWVTTGFFYGGPIDMEPEDPDVNTLEIADDIEVDVSDMSSDFKLATAYLDGELFHVNMGHWHYMSQFTGGQVRDMYIKAAQFRVIDAGRHTENVRQLIKAGWVSGQLELPEALQHVDVLDPVSGPMEIRAGVTSTSEQQKKSDGNGDDRSAG